MQLHGNFKAYFEHACHCRTAETHELAKRKASEMDKIRAAFGLGDDAKEGQAFDRDLQERLKAERMAEREAKQKAKEKEDKRRKKEQKKKAKQEKKAAKKQAKAEKKAAALKAEVCSLENHKSVQFAALLLFIQQSASQVQCSIVPAIMNLDSIDWSCKMCTSLNYETSSLALCPLHNNALEVMLKSLASYPRVSGSESCEGNPQRRLLLQEDKKLAEEKAKRDAERAKLQAEAKAKRQKDLQARLGPRADGRRRCGLPVPHNLCSAQPLHVAGPHILPNTLIPAAVL